MLARYSEIQDYVKLALSYLNDAPSSLTKGKKEIIEGVLKILKPFFQLQKKCLQRRLNFKQSDSKPVLFGKQD